MLNPQIRWWVNRFPVKEPVGAGFSPRPGDLRPASLFQSRAEARSYGALRLQPI